MTPDVTIHSPLKLEKDQHMRVNENIGPAALAPYSNSSYVNHIFMNWL